MKRQHGDLQRGEAAAQGSAARGDRSMGGRSMGIWRFKVTIATYLARPSLNNKNQMAAVTFNISYYANVASLYGFTFPHLSSSHKS